MRIEVRGRNVEVTDELRDAVDEALRADRPPGLRARPARGRAARGAQPLDRRPPRRRGDPLPQGRDAARARGLAGDAALDPRARRGHPPAGQAPPREAPRARERPPRGRAAAAPHGVAERGPAARRERYPESFMARGIIDRALRLGEGRRLKEYQQRGRAGQPLRAGARAARRRRDPRARRRAPPARPRGRRVARRPAPGGVRARPRGEQAVARPAPLRRPADRRHGPALGRDRRDEDRRGQDPDRDPGRVPQHARRRRRPPGHRQRLPRPPRRALDEADLRRCSASRSA